jgi:hypothetical protein
MSCSEAAEWRAAVENVDLDSETAPGRRYWRHKPKMPDAEAPD